MNELVKELEAIKGYKDLFEGAYPGEGISKSTIGKAIATFERTVVSKDSRFDAWISGDEKAINESAKNGFGLFIGRGFGVVAEEVSKLAISTSTSIKEIKQLVSNSYENIGKGVNEVSQIANLLKDIIENISSLGLSTELILQNLTEQNISYLGVHKMFQN